MGLLHCAVGGHERRGRHPEAPEGAERRAVGVAEQLIGDAGPLGQIIGQARVVGGVDAKDPHLFAQLLADRFEVGHLRGTRRAPRRPEVHHQGRPDEAVQIHGLTGERRQRHIRQVRPVRRLSRRRADDI